METTNNDNNTMEDDVIDINIETPVPQKTKKPRKIKPLPEDLATLTDSASDRDKFSIAKEADANNKSPQFGKELAAVQSVHIMKDDKEVIYDLKTLNVDQLRLLCKNVGDQLWEQYQVSVPCPHRELLQLQKVPERPGIEPSDTRKAYYFYHPARSERDFQ
jgi:hypothetical protein